MNFDFFIGVNCSIVILIYCPLHILDATTLRRKRPISQTSTMDRKHAKNVSRGVPILLKFWQFWSELAKTWSSGATECGVWIGNCNVKVWKSTECSIVQSLAVLYRVCLNISIVLLWEIQSRQTWIGTKFRKSSTPMGSVKFCTNWGKWEHPWAQ